MYQFVVSFDVQPEHRDDFIRAAQRSGRDALENEPGALRFEILADPENPDVVYLNEAYADLDAFNTHASGPYFAAFYADVSAYAEGPTFLMRANLVAEQAA